jgi:predicted lipoprotein with Yx(FWY)xxD motif
MLMKKTVLVVALALAVAAAGAATAAAITHQSSAAAAKLHGTVNLRKTSIGKVLVTKSGLTLYLFLADHHKKSSCYGQCAGYWPPLMKKGKLSAGKGLKAKYLGTTKRKNGKRQVTYKGHPLYRFKLDHGPGKLAGQGQDFFGGRWYAVSASGRPNKKSPPQTGTTTTSTTTTQYTTTSRY